jgi:Fic family protein
MDPKLFVVPAMGEVVPAIGPDGTYFAFVPAPIPRQVHLLDETVAALSRADMALGRLAGAGRLLPNPHILVSPYVLREAVSSSAIEGTQASVSDMYRAEAEGESREDVLEVRNYIAALNQGLGLLGTLPISKRLAAEIHGVLLRGVRGRERTPGEFRTTQNYIGSPDDRPQTAVFVPPPAGEPMERALGDWERFHHEDHQLPLLIRCALLHYQFETIHPFLDGNGRLGRLLIVFFLVAQNALPQPLLYLSAYFERNRREYTERLQSVRERGEIQEWLRFFLTGVEAQAIDAVERAEKLADLRESYRRALAGTRSRAPEVVDLLFESPIVSAPQIAARLGVSGQGAKYLIDHLQRKGLVSDYGERLGRRRSWVADQILEAVSR